MNRRILAGLALVAAAGVALGLRASTAPRADTTAAQPARASDDAVNATARQAPTPVAQTIAATTTHGAAAPRDDEQADEPVEHSEARAIDALVAAGDIGEARRQAEDFLRRHPSGPLAHHVAILTGVHGRPGPQVLEEQR